MSNSASPIAEALFSPCCKIKQWVAVLTAIADAKTFFCVKSEWDFQIQAVTAGFCDVSCAVLWKCCSNWALCLWQISGMFFGAYFNTAGLWTPSCNQPLYFHIEFSVSDTLARTVRWMYTVNLEHCKHSFHISPWKAVGCDGRKRFAFRGEAVTIWTVPITTSENHLKHVSCSKSTIWCYVTFVNAGGDLWGQFDDLVQYSIHRAVWCWNEGVPAGPAPRRSAHPCLHSQEKSFGWR